MQSGSGMSFQHSPSVRPRLQDYGKRSYDHRACDRQSLVVGRLLIEGDKSKIIV